MCPRPRGEGGRGGRAPHEEIESGAPHEEIDIGAPHADVPHLQMCHISAHIQLTS